MNTLKISYFLFNWKSESRLGLFVTSVKKTRNKLILNSFLFNSNSESGFNLLKKVY
jgi:hypothetical protein